MSTSSFVAWETIRRSDSRAIKKSVGTFSTDPMSLTGKHSFSNSSVQAKAVGVRAVAVAGARAARFVLTTKVVGKGNKPKLSIKTAKMGTHKKAARVANIVTMGAAKPVASSTAYRADLHQAVMSRFSTLQRAEKRRIAKSTRRAVPIKKVKA